VLCLPFVPVGAENPEFLCLKLTDILPQFVPRAQDISCRQKTTVLGPCLSGQSPQICRQNQQETICPRLDASCKLFTKLPKENQTIHGEGQSSRRIWPETSSSAPAGGRSSFVCTARLPAESNCRNPAGFFSFKLPPTWHVSNLLTMERHGSGTKKSHSACTVRSAADFMCS
jgi:hypothetical protein